MHGNLLILDITLKNKRLSFINVYGPNKDTPTFFEEIRKYMSESVHDSVILMGDYNLVLDPESDTKYCSIKIQRLGKRCYSAFQTFRQSCYSRFI